MTTRAEVAEHIRRMRRPQRRIGRSGSPPFHATAETKALVKALAAESAFWPWGRGRRLAQYNGLRHARSSTPSGTAGGPRPRSLRCTPNRQKTPEHRLKMAPFRLDRRLRCLRQHPPYIFVAFRPATAVVLFRAYVLPRAGPHPKGQVPNRGKTAGLHAHFGNHLLCRVRSETGPLRQPRHRLLMRFQGLGDEAAELRYLRVDQLELVQVRRQQLLVHRQRVVRQGINELRLGTLQPVVAQRRQLPGVGLALDQGVENTQPAGPEQIAEHPGKLDPHLLQLVPTRL